MRLMQMLRRAISKLDSRENIKLSSGLYLRVPILKATVVSRVPDVLINEDLSLEETRLLLRSIKAAMDEWDLKTVTIRGITWKLDARRKGDSEYVKIQFRRGIQFYSDATKREDVLSALHEFAQRFGAI